MSNGVSKIQLGKLYPVCGLACFTFSLYSEWPDLIGCSSMQDFLVFNGEMMTCKPSKGNPRSWFLLHLAECNLGPPNILLKSMSQCFCFDCRFSAHFPPDEDQVPCIVTLCFLTLYHKGKMQAACFKKFSEL
jgi:hypothetical protein